MEGLKEKLKAITSGKSVGFSKEDWSNIERGQMIFSGTLVLLAVLSWLAIYLSFDEIYGGIQAWLFVMLSIFMLATGVGLSFFLLRPSNFAILTYLVISLTTLLFFGWSGYVLAGSGIFFLATVFGYIIVKREQSLLIKFLYARLIRRGMPIFFTGLTLMLAIVYSASPLGRVLEHPQLPRAFFDVILVPAEYLVKQALPEFHRDIKLKEVEELATREAPKFLDVPPEILGSAIQKMFSNIPAESQDKTLADFLHETINRQLAAILTSYKNFLPIAFLFGLFLVFRAISIPLMWLSFGTGWIAIRILLAFGILKLKKVETDKEVLVL